MKVVQATLRRIQARHNLSVTAMAETLDITRPSLSIVINGRGALSINLALKLQERFGLNARELLIAQLDEDIEAATNTHNK